MADTAEATKRDYSQKEREQMDSSDFAGPHMSFPIKSQQDVYNAARLIGHADNPEAVKARIIAIARRKGFDIPDAWKEGADKSFMGTPFAMTVPITKVDLAQRIVYGVAALEQVDKAGEIFDYESSKPHFQAWTSDFSKRTGGKSKGNVREMHRDVAAGKLTNLNFNDAQKQVEVAAKVVDDAAWEKVQEGVYTGFSIGGSYADKWNDPAGKGLRYTAKPSEISLVDNPCMPGATFTAVKSDGTTEVRKFATTKEETTVDDEKVEKTADSTEADTEEIAYDDGRPVPDSLDGVQKDDMGGDMMMAAGAKDKGEKPGDSADDDEPDDDEDDNPKAKKDDSGYMAMSERLDGLEKVVVSIGSLLEKLDARLAAEPATETTETTEATQTPAEKLDKIEQPTEESGDPLAKVTKIVDESLRKVTDAISQLEARLAKIENEPVPGGPFLTAEAMEKAAKAGVLSVADKTLDTDNGLGFDPANKGQAIGALKKLMQETTDPFRKQELGAWIFEMEFREGLESGAK